MFICGVLDHDVQTSPLPRSACPDRAVIDRCVFPHEVVLEVGCCGGDTTARISKRALRAVGIDLADAQVAKAKRVFPREEFPNLQFRAMDATDVSALCRLKAEVGYSVIFLDINGNREVRCRPPCCRWCSHTVPRCRKGGPNVLAVVRQRSGQQHIAPAVGMYP